VKGHSMKRGRSHSHLKRGPGRRSHQSAAIVRRQAVRATEGQRGEFDQMLDGSRERRS
jgi:hypothetical protein